MSDNSTPVVATKRINGEIEPGTIIVPAEHDLDIDELNALDAVRECTDADLAVHEQMVAQASGDEAAVTAAAEKAAARKAAREAAKAAEAEAAEKEAAAKAAEEEAAAAEADIG